MIKTITMLRDELHDYTNQASKINQLVKNGKLVPIVRGLYETNKNLPGYLLAPIIYGPSYLSFEFALAYYSLIPEAVHNFTSATFEKKKVKSYDTPYGIFIYRDVPSEAYPYGVTLKSENGYGYQIATAEKAICDMLYTVSPMKNRTELETYLFENLRIDQEEFFRLNMVDLFEITNHFHTQNHKLLKAYIKRRMKNESNN